MLLSNLRFLVWGSGMLECDMGVDASESNRKCVSFLQCSKHLVSHRHGLPPISVGCEAHGPQTIWGNVDAC